ncbi:type IV secretion system protein [Rubrivivax albus]|uniref:Type IV secretion system protein n=1 Tax=Rubrivivax albus TaxID=2499835 RepID=A0A3S2U261_9BURK|nr:type IV secretion system protein [Rubrivivax albus]RVT50761.1 type IV secretion system protein [Rubrivivax albus]
MFTWLGTQLHSVLDDYVLGVVTALAEALAPVALAAMSLWVLLYGWAVLRGEVRDTVPNFLWNTTKIGLVLAVALQSGLYVATVADSANALASGVAATFLPDGVPDDTIDSPFALLDEFNDNAGQQVADLMAEAGITRLDLMLAATAFSIGSVAFLCIAVFVVVLATVFLSFVIGVGPIFLLCLAWRPTQRFFDSWLSMLLNAVVLTWFAFFALGLSTYVGREMFLAIQAAGGFLGGALNALSESLRYCVLMLVMAIICFQAPTLASALTGGAAVQQGMQMIHNVLMLAGLRAVSTQRAASGALAGPGGGGVVRPTVPAAVAAVGAAAARPAAYRLAALRGRR